MQKKPIFRSSWKNGLKAPAIRRTRETPLAYITKCRIQRSKHLLVQQPVLPIKEVAISSGYPGLSYFNKRFMEAEGMTPGEFRNRHLSR